MKPGPTFAWESNLETFSAPRSLKSTRHSKTRSSTPRRPTIFPLTVRHVVSRQEVTALRIKTAKKECQSPFSEEAQRSNSSLKFTLRCCVVCRKKEANTLSTMNASTTNPPHGLSHLVAAATALATLTGGVPSAANPVHALTSLQQVTANISLRPAPTLQAHSSTSLTHPTTASSAGEGNGKLKIFPERLMDILNDKSLVDTVTWLPHGRSFVIIRPDVFTEQVLPKYLPPVDTRSSTKYPSFTRKLNRW